MDILDRAVSSSDLVYLSLINRQFPLVVLIPAVGKAIIQVCFTVPYHDLRISFSLVFSILCFGFEAAIERYTARILKIVRVGSALGYICLDAVGISEGYSSSSVSHVNRDASHPAQRVQYSSELAPADLPFWKMHDKTLFKTIPDSRVDHNINVLKYAILFSWVLAACQNCK